MSPLEFAGVDPSRSFPRVSGDEPDGWYCVPVEDMFSPRERG